MVSKEDINTYTHGFNLTLKDPLSKDDVVQLCLSLQAKFGEGNIFRPEGIGGGFIQWVDWPGLNGDEAYKSMRICKNENWPNVHEDAMSTWVGDQSPAIGAGKYGTFLKAFNKAPAWTKCELKMFKSCLENAGFKVTRLRIKGLAFNPN